MTPLRTPRAWHKTERVTQSNNGQWKGGRHITGGYIRVRVKSHPKQDRRGYVLEHVLVMEEKLKRFLRQGEYVHHKDGNRQNNDADNLELMYSHKEHMDQHPRARNHNKQFVAADPIFEEIKFRLFDADAGVTKIYTLSKLINTTFRRGKFQFRGRSTGLHDRQGKEIFESDILRIVWKTAITLDEREGSTKHRERRTFVCEVKFGEGQVFGSEWDHDIIGFYLLPTIEHCNLCRNMLEDNEVEVIGNRFEHPHLLPSA